MAAQDLILHLPQEIYHQIQERARNRNRSIEDETLQILVSALPNATELPDDLASAIAPLDLLDDESLRRAAGSHLPRESAAALEELHLKQQREGLTETEAQARDALVRQYERAMLIRAEAGALLHKRAVSLAD